MSNFAPVPEWIEPAWRARFEAARTTAHRLATAEDGWVERFGADVLVSWQSEAARDRALQGLDAWGAAAEFAPRRVFGKFLPLRNAERAAPLLLRGAPGEKLTTVVEENGVRYGMDFAAGYSAGLFIDQRQNRLFLRRRPVRRLLNTFAYTCSFSVVAALAGAATTSLDLSRKSLARGEENFQLNNLPLAGHQFIADDVLEMLPRLARRGEKYDAIVLDPPTFSRGEKGRRFQVEVDFEKLLVSALEVAAPGAAVLLSTNCHRLQTAHLQSMAKYALKLLRRQGKVQAEPALPDFPAGAGARTLWLLLQA